MKPAILIVDRQVAVRQIIQQSLHKTGYRTAIVESAVDALNLLNKHDFQGIIIDDDLDGMGGGQLCRTIKTQAATQHIPVVLASESLRVTNPDYVKATGADAAFLKPVSTDKIVETMELLLIQSILNSDSTS